MPDGDVAAAVLLIGIVGTAWLGWRIYRTPPPPRISPQRLRQLLRQQRAREERR